MHKYLKNLIVSLNTNKVFRFISSIKLAVPVMLLIIIAVATGTVLESQHNAEYAKMAVYNTNWFFIILLLLLINIFASMMSRFPWKAHQVGFVLTHTGMIILLIGSFITGYFGTDGSLQIPEGQSNNVVILPKLSVGYQLDQSTTINSVPFEKSLFEKSESSLSFVNDKISHIFTVEKFIPFAKAQAGFKLNENDTESIGISFQLKSNFFDVKEWLHSKNNPQMNMGPATIKLIIDSPNSSQNEAPPQNKNTVSSPSQSDTVDSNTVKFKTANSKTAAKINSNNNRSPSNTDKNSKSNAEYLVISKDNKELKKVRLPLEKQNIVTDGVTILITKRYLRAVVSQNKIEDNIDPNFDVNPALELKLEKNNQSFREIVYAKFPGFSINKEGTFGLSFKYLVDTDVLNKEMTTDNLPPNHPKIDASDTMNSVNTSAEEQPINNSESAEDRVKNTIEFHVNKNDLSKVTIQLWKSKKLVSQQDLKEGDNFQTPWMGMQIFLGSIAVGTQAVTDAIAINPEPGKVLPPSAVKIRPVDSQESFWLMQGESKQLTIANRNLTVFFGNELLQLPFSLTLNKFSKKDYPGTETPYSYESLVTLLTDNSLHTISMNEPLKYDGYTLYQASFIMQPNQAPITVLSVNKDPGRFIKYFGSLVLSLGIILFTLMKSNFYKQRQNRGKNV